MRDARFLTQSLMPRAEQFSRDIFHPHPNLHLNQRLVGDIHVPKGGRNEACRFQFARNQEGFHVTYCQNPRFQNQCIDMVTFNQSNNAYFILLVTNGDNHPSFSVLKTRKKNRYCILWQYFQRGFNQAVRYIGRWYANNGELTAVCSFMYSAFHYLS